LLRDLRSAGIAADMDPSGRSVKSQFKLADREKASYCVIVGETELAADSVVLKNLTDRGTADDLAHGTGYCAARTAGSLALFRFSLLAGHRARD
jgi:histidyl-tRNA synthetase